LREKIQGLPYRLSDQLVERYTKELTAHQVYGQEDQPQDDEIEEIVNTMFVFHDLRAGEPSAGRRFCSLA
jgi:hypothetical protein